MPVLSPQDMIDRYGESFLTDVTARDSAPGVIDATVMQTAIDDAIALVESHVSGLYDVANPPRALTAHAAAIAWFRLLGARAATFDGAREGHDDAIDFLRRARRGEVSLGDETPADTARGAGHAPRVSGPAPVFSRDSFEGF
jgi:phage gp36-like protein